MQEEPTLTFRIESGLDYTTTFSNLQKEGYHMIDGYITRLSVEEFKNNGDWLFYSKDAKLTPLNWYDIWNYDLITHYGENRSWVEEQISAGKKTSSTFTSRLDEIAR